MLQSMATNHNILNMSTYIYIYIYTTILTALNKVLKPYPHKHFNHIQEFIKTVSK